MVRLDRFVLALAFSLLLFAGFSIAQVSTFFGPSDSSAVKAVISGAQGKDGTFSSLKETYQAVVALKALGADIPHAKEITDYATKKLTQTPLEADTAFYATGVLSALGASLPSVDISKLVSAASSFPNIYFVAGASKALKSTAGLAALLPQITSLMEDDGIVKTDNEADAGTFENAGYALHAVASIVAAGVADKEDEHVKDVVGKVDSLFGSGKETKGADGPVLYFVDDDDTDARVGPLESTANIVTGAGALAEALGRPLKITGDQTSRLAQYFIEKRQVSDVASAFAVSTALKTLAGSESAGSLLAPLVLSVDQHALPLGAKDGIIKVSLTDLFGQFITAAKVTLVEASLSGSSSPLVKDKELKAVEGKNTQYSFDFLEAKPEQGSYALDFKVVPQGGRSVAPIKSVTKSFKITSSAGLANAELSLESKVDDAVKKFSPTFPSTEPITADDSFRLKLSFSVKSASGKSFTPHQAFVSLTTPISKKQIVLLPKLDDSVYKITLDIGELNTKQFKGESGDYKLDIIAGDSVFEGAIVWSIAKLSLTLKEVKSEKEFDLRDVSRDQLLTEPQKEMIHSFRAPDRRPPAIVSYVFTALVVLPFLILLVVWGGLGVNISNFPFSGKEFLSAVGLQGTIIAVIVVCIAFWVSLPFSKVLWLLSGLSVVGVFFGHKALADVANKSLGKVKTS
mmetsp:Transcript_35502/g.57446  ORF Transcript_35502/g.57446 Transcript_35502/m.57446 type:complete len:686 (-) Transcript_35502:187-2244(-)